MLRSDLCIEQTTRHTVQEPRGRHDLFGSKLRRVAVSFCTFCAILLFASCRSSENTTLSDSPLGSASDSSTAEIMPDTAATKRPEIVTGPISNGRNREAGLTIGERLKHIDSLMQTAPPDSLGILMAEYERLLDSAMGGPASQEPSRQESSTPIAAKQDEPTTERNAVRSTPRSSINAGGDSRTLVQSDYSGKGSDSAFDPTIYQGARPSEIEYYKQNTPSQTTTGPENSASSNTKSSGSPTIADATPAPSSTTAPSASKKGSTKGSGKKVAAKTTSKNSKKGKGKASKKKSGKSDAAPAVASSSPSSKSKSKEQKSSASSSLQENYSEGLAQFRAGNYKGAITNLKPVANSSSSSWRTTAKYYYALSLERTGSLSQAASQFQSLMKGSGAFADKSWIGYCRVLTSQGKKAAAKKELLRFISQRSGSSQISTARQMLQKL